MAAMEGVLPSQAQPQQQQQQQEVMAVERLNEAVQQQLNLASVKTRALSLMKAISRILEDFDVYARTNSNPKWQDILGQYSMVNLELFNIVDEIKKVSKAFVVHPKNVNAENSTILPVMLSSKLLPEMETEDNAKREQLIHGMQNLPVTSQIEKLKERIDMIAAACEGAEKILADTRKAYCFGTRQGAPILPTLDKGQAAKIQEQENIVRAAVNYGEGLRLPGDQRQVTSVALPMHLVDVLSTGDGMQSYSETSGMFMKSNPMSSNNLAGQSPLMQTPGSQLLGRTAASPGAPTASFDNTTTSPLPYANSPKSSATLMNTPSPQQQIQQQQPQQQQQQQQQQQHQLQQQQLQRQKLMQLPQHQQQLFAQQQYRQSTMQGLGQTQLPQLHDLQGQAQQKFQPLHGQHQMQFSQPMGHQQFQGRQLTSSHVQHGIGQSQLNQGTQMNRHLNQFSGTANSALFNAAQTTTNPQMIPNMSGTMPSSSFLPRVQMQQYGLPGNNPQRTQTSQILGDQMFNMGAGNPGGMMPIQQQQPQQGTFGNIPQNAQNLQSGMASLQNNPQSHPNFGQQNQQ